MTVQSLRIRCSGELHTISWENIEARPFEQKWTNSRISHPGSFVLENHPRRTAAERAIYAATASLSDEDLPRCLKLIRLWKSALFIYRRNFRKSAPPLLVKLLLSSQDYGSMRRMMFRYHCEDDPLNQDLLLRVSQSLTSKAEKLFRESHRYLENKNKTIFKSSTLFGDKSSIVRCYYSDSPDGPDYRKKNFRDPRYIISCSFLPDWFRLYKRGEATADGYLVINHLTEKEVSDKPVVPGYFYARALRLYQTKQIDFDWAPTGIDLGVSDCLISADGKNLKWCFPDDDNK